MLDRLGKFLLDPDEFEAAVSAAVAGIALDPGIPAAYAAHRAEQRAGEQERRKGRKRKPQATSSFPEKREDGWFRPHPAHPWLDPAACGDPGHVPARPAVAVDGKERKGAKSGGEKKMHLLAAVTHVPGLVIAQDRIAAAGKANAISHFEPMLAPLPLEGAVVTTDAMQANRDNSLFLRAVKGAHWLWPVLGNQPNLNAQLNGLDGRKRPSPPRPARPPAAASRPAPSASCPRPKAPCSRTRSRPISSSGTSRTEKGPVADPCRVRSLPHQPRHERDHAAGPPRPRPRPLAGRAHPLATR